MKSTNLYIVSYNWQLFLTISLPTASLLKPVNRNSLKIYIFKRESYHDTSQKLFLMIFFNQK